MKPHGQIQNVDGAATAREGEQVIDPVCGMTVNKETAAGSYEHNGQKYFFCSNHCLEQFRTNPDRFLKQSTPQAGEESKHSATAKAEYTCPMHPQIVRDKPGKPICDMTNRATTVSLEDEREIPGGHTSDDSQSPH